MTGGSWVEFKCVFGEDLISWVWLLPSMTFRHTAGLFFFFSFFLHSGIQESAALCLISWSAQLVFELLPQVKDVLGSRSQATGAWSMRLLGRLLPKIAKSSLSGQGAELEVNLCSNVHLRSWALRVNLKNEIVQDYCGRPGSASEVGWGNHTSRELRAVPLRWKDPTDVVLGSDLNASAIKLARQISQDGTPLLMNFKGLRGFFLGVSCSGICLHRLRAPCKW